MAEPSSDAATASATRKNKADPGWKYCHSLVEGDTNTIVCNFCGKITKGGITRAKQHLIGKSGNVAACKKTPPNVIEELKEYMATKKLKKKRSRPRLLPVFFFFVRSLRCRGLLLRSSPPFVRAAGGGVAAAAGWCRGGWVVSRLQVGCWVVSSRLQVGSSRRFSCVRLGKL